MGLKLKLFADVNSNLIVSITNENEKEPTLKLCHGVLQTFLVKDELTLKATLKRKRYLAILSRGIQSNIGLDIIFPQHKSYRQH